MNCKYCRRWSGISLKLGKSITLTLRWQTNRGESLKHTENWLKRHKPPEHSKNYDRSFSRTVMKQFVTDMRRRQQGLPVRERRNGETTLLQEGK